MVEDTTKSQHPEWLRGLLPRAIEMQESVGQKELCEGSKDLPRYTSDRDDTIPTYKKMGIKILDDKSDDLFVTVQLPEGWRIIPTDHSMWNKLVDSKNRVRGHIFYKAAFYDRSAHISFNRRYHYEVVTWSEKDESEDEHGDFYEKKMLTPVFGRVSDQDKIIFETSKECFDHVYEEKTHKKWWNEYDRFYKSKGDECIKFLDGKYPKWKDIFAYW